MQQADLAQAAEALRESRRREARNAATLQTTLENIDQGLLMVDSSGRIAAYNQRVLELLGLPASLLAGRPRFGDVLAYQWERNEFANVDPRLVALINADRLDDQSYTYERMRPNGRMIEVRSQPLHGGGLVRTYADVTERKVADARMRFIAYHDNLTLLANRIVLQDRLDQAVTASPASGLGVALLYIDLDRFKPINDMFGHAVGDQLLVEVAQRMRGMVREEDLVARMGGDEFAIVQTAVGQPEAAASLAGRLIERMSHPFLFNNTRISIGLSIGVGVCPGVLHPGPGITAAELRRNADVALYRAKENGGNTVQFFDAAMDHRQQARFQMEQDLREAVGLRAFHLMYQPITNTETGAVVGYEALLRWTHPIRGAVGPEEFVTLAELNGLIMPIGRWVLETACAEAAEWPARLRVAVNLSPLQFRQDNLADEIVGILRRTGLPPDRLELEVTEGLLLDESSQVLQTMHALRALGVSMTLDDFGTGHASLSYLRRFPFNKIKIDKSFIRNLQEDPQSLAIVEAVLLLSRRLGLNVVAEGVETEVQFDMLRRLRCPLVQGFLHGAPMLAEAIPRPG